MTNAAPKGWTEVPLGEIATCQGGSAFSPALQGRTAGDIPFFKVSDMNLPGNGWFMRRANNYVSLSDTSRILGAEKPSGSVIFPKVGAAVHTNKKRQLTQDSFVDNNVMAVWSKDPERCRPGFLYLYFLTVDLSTMSNPGPLPSINNSKVYEQTIRLPTSLEQDRICATMLTIRRAIEAEEKAITLIREVKQAALLRLFSQGLRGESLRDTEIGLVPASWDIQPFAELREFLQYGTSVKCDYALEGNPVLRIPNVVDGRVDYRDLKRCRLDSDTVASLLLEPGDILFIRTNGVRERVGTCAVYDGVPEQALFASYLIRARPKRGVLNPQYLQYFTATRTGASQLAGRSSPAADGKFNINTKSIDAVLVPIPSEAEQNDIVGVLETIDAAATSYERRRATLSELFATLLEKLMTADLRVDHLNIDTSLMTAA
ncbi:MAG: restriction endonuclease subunit S [Patescibacteria group bacterium]